MLISGIWSLILQKMTIIHPNTTKPLNQVSSKSLPKKSKVWMKNLPCPSHTHRNTEELWTTQQINSKRRNTTIWWLSDSKLRKRKLASLLSNKNINSRSIMNSSMTKMTITIWITSCKLTTNSNNSIHRALVKIKMNSINSKTLEGKCNGRHKATNQKTTLEEVALVHSNNNPSSHSNSSVSNLLNFKYLCMELLR